jgi:glycosyltransferase involved in cell wall biosynthesis
VRTGETVGVPVARTERRPPPALTYLTVDGIASGVGASQVLPYVEGLARHGARVTVHSFESQPPAPGIRARLEGAGVDWHHHRVRRYGAAAAALRVFEGAALVRGPALVHARSDLPAASALVARSEAWVWDVRSFWADQRIAMGMLRAGSRTERVLRAIESAAATRASAIVTLTAAAVDELAARHGEAVRAKTTVIPTCVDLEHFALAPLPDAARIQVLLSGTFNRLYDLDLTLRFVESLRRVRSADVTLLRPGTSPWDGPVAGSGGRLASAPFAAIPEWVRASHAGVCLCRVDNRAAIAGAAPTKLAEFLAMGRPVVVNAGLGDMDAMVARHRCGVIVADRSAAGLLRAASDLLALIDDAATPGRCRAAAEEHFDLEVGVSRLIDVYQGQS